VNSDSAVADAYDRRADEYIEIAGRIEQLDPRDAETVRVWRDATAGPLLDAGCGPGLWTSFLHEGGRDVRGVDVSTAFVAAARAAYPGIRFEVASFRRLPVPSASLGGVLSWYSLIHTPPDDVPEVLAELARVMAPGGSLLLGFFDGAPREPFAHAVAPAYFWSPEALGALLADAGFAVSASERRGRAPGEVSARPHAAVTAIRAA
jgi:SAM-dependent methyltransferase